MRLIERLQGYLRHCAQQQYHATHVPPFTIFCHPQDEFLSFNYAIPDEPVGEGLQEALEGLRAEFVRQERQPRFEFIEQYAPQLPSALQEAGFEEESRTQFMLCTPESYRRAPLVAGLSVTRHASLLAHRWRRCNCCSRRGIGARIRSAGKRRRL